MTEGEIEAPKRETEKVYCHCLVIYNGDEESRCDNRTSGPDEPFCFDCSDRHVGNEGVKDGSIKVEARLREKEAVDG